MTRRRLKLPDAMRIDILTILPEMVTGALAHGVIGRALVSGLCEVGVVNLRDYADDRHRTTDDTPCGGGGGMIMKAEPIARALEAVSAASPPDRVILTDPQGEPFTQSIAVELAACRHIAIVCGRYEGVDDRVATELMTHAYSIGDYVLTGGEMPALVMADAVLRLQPGVLGQANAPDLDSFSGGLLDYPQFTRPRRFRGVDVPKALLHGDEAAIARWRRYQQLDRTRRRRPDLWSGCAITEEDLVLLSHGPTARASSLRQP